MPWMKVILGNWKLILIGMAIALATVLWMRLATVTAQRDLAENNLNEYRRLSNEAMKTEVANNDQANDSIRAAIPLLVESAKTEAYKNYLAKLGRGNAACGIRADGLRDVRTSGGSHPYDGAESADGPSGERLVIEACARDAGRLDLWIERCKLSPKLCQVEE
jgi:hypothetical protein